MPDIVYEEKQHYFTSEGGAIGANLVVIAGTASPQIKLPGAADVEAFVVTLAASTAAAERQLCALPGTFVRLKVGAAGVAYGARVGIAGTDGRIATQAAGATKFSVGVAFEAGVENDLVSVWFSPAPNNT